MTNAPAEHLDRVARRVGVEREHVDDGRDIDVGHLPRETREIMPVALNALDFFSEMHRREAPVEQHGLVAELQQAPHDGRADETRSAENKHAHGCDPPS